MPTRRMIHVELWQSETIGALTRDQRLMFIGLFSNADDQGRLQGHPAVVRGIVFPYDDISLKQIQDDLQALADGDFIIRYGAGTKSLIQIKNWWQYQQPQWAYPSAHPCPDGWDDCIRGRKGGKVYTENWPPPQWNRKAKSLPKDLPNAKGNTDGQSDSIGKDSTRTSDSTESPNGSACADDEAQPPAEPEQLNESRKEPERPQPPQNLAGWIDVLQTVKNKQALIRRFIELHYPKHDVPSYGYVAKVAKQLGRGVNGYKRLLSLLYQVECHNPQGDLLPYVLAVSKNDKANAAYYRDGHDQNPAPIAGEDRGASRPEPEPPSPLEQEWQAALVELRAAFGDQPVAQWLHSSALLERENGHAKIELADEACVDWVENRWKAQLADVLRAPGGSAPELEFTIAERATPAWLGETTPLSDIDHQGAG